MTDSITEIHKPLQTPDKIQEEGLSFSFNKEMKSDTGSFANERDFSEQLEQELEDIQNQGNSKRKQSGDLTGGQKVFQKFSIDGVSKEKGYF